MTSELSDFLPILIMFVVAGTVGIGGAVVSWVAGPKKPSETKRMSYESGMVPIGSARIRFPVKFYLVAMLFIVFDVEIVFFYPWAVALHRLRLFGLAEMAVFAGLLLVGYVYVWRKGALRWE